jgi:hypothetical protein
VNAQTADHLAKANRYRSAQAEAKRRIANGDLSAAKVIGDPGPELRGMKVLALLQSIRQVGSYRATTICSGAGVNPLTRLGDLSVRQRLRLMDGLQRYPSSRDA